MKLAQQLKARGKPTSLVVAAVANRYMRWLHHTMQPESLAAGGGSIWVLCRKDGKIDRIDPKTNKVSKTIDLGVPNADGAIAFGEGFLWVTEAGFPLARIDITSESVVQQFQGEGGGVLAVSPGAIWLGNVKAGTIWRIDPKRVMTTLPE